MEHFILSEKYRPLTVDECILPEKLKNVFKSFVAQKAVPNLILSGKSGVGKTTVAKAMLEELDCDYITIPASLNGNIDTLRNDIQKFASTVSVRDGRKYVILDEADYLNSQSTMPALRNFIDQYGKNCGFILTCNYLHKIMPELQSRCSVIEFNFPVAEKQALLAAQYKRAVEILKKEKVTFDKNVVGHIVLKFYPDFRNAINNIQRSIVDGNLSVVIEDQQNSIEQLIKILKAKNFNETRKWAAENNDINSTTLIRGLYDSLGKVLQPDSVAQLILLLGEYQFKAAFVADHEINNVAMLTEIYNNCNFK